MSIGPREFNPYSRKQRKELDDIVDMRVKRPWFENYRENMDLVRRWGGITNVPLIDKAVVVGAGWSLDWNIGLLKDCKTPVISTDKSLKRVIEAMGKHPYAVCALNTQETEVAQWLDIGETDTWLIAPVTAHPDTFKNWKGRIAFINPQNTCPELYELVYRETGIRPSLRGCNVGYFSLITAYTLNARMVAMLGMNYCYRTEEEAMIASNHDHCVKMRDVNGNYVYTVLDWLDARREILDFTFQFLDEMKVVNCSEGGIIYEPDVIDPLPFNVWRKHE